ncbi:MAG TPA: flagellar filament capping protein FliD [Bryobacteraceae bacterium]|nr:flagellar filament capping protein FliD [Bryobacteraceae bacterium]
MSTSPLTFTGVSTYSSDLQTISDRANQLGQIPITRLQNAQTDDSSKSQLLGNLNTVVAALGTSVAALGALGANQGLTASSSDPDTVSVMNTGATTANTYTISNITSIAAPASEMTLTGYADSNTTQLSSSGQYKLLYGSNTYSISLSSSQNNLVGLNNAINSLGVGVASSIITTGTGANPNYLQVSSETVGATTLRLQNVPSPVDKLGATDADGNATSISSSADSASTAVSATGNMQLVYGGSTYQIALGSGQNNLQGLSDAINNLGVGLTAAVASSGTGAAPYSLSISGNTAQSTLKLQDLQAPVNLLTQTNQGANTEFVLGTASVSKPSTNINDVIPGVSFQILQKDPTGSVTISLATDRTQLSNGLKDLATKYNAVVDEINKEMGTSPGLLAGDSVIRQVQDDLRQVTMYNGNGTGVHSLAQLGIELDKTGKMSLNETTFNNLPDSKITQAFTYLGSATTGFGTLADTISQLTDPYSGLIQAEQASLNTAYTKMGEQITTLQDRLTISQNALTQKLQQADTLLASLQNQQTILNSSVSSVDLVMYGKDWGTQVSQ